MNAPRLLAGVEPLGEYQGSGLTDATFLVRDPEGRVVQVSRLLHLVLSGIDGQRAVSEIAARVSAEFGRTVSTGNVEYLLDHKLAPLGLLARADGAPGPANPGWDRGVLTLRFRCTLIPEAGVQFFARLFRPLFTPAVVVAALGGLIVSDVWLVRAGQLNTALGYVVIHPVLLLLVLGLTLLSTLFHECGHAAACRYGGARPGVIGMGVYVVWPAFFTNVTDAYRLGRAGRIRTDLGGVYFNAIFSAGLAAVYLATGYQPVLAAVLLVHVEMVQQLLPSLRFDGYFILADRRRHRPAPSRRPGPPPPHADGPPAHRAVKLRPVSAHGFDPLDTQGDPNDENDALAGYAIDGNPATAWRSQYYLGNPVFGGLKAGSGLILDMGRRVRLRSVTVTFGAEPGADVAVEIGGSHTHGGSGTTGGSGTLAAPALGTFTTVATADGVGGTHTFRTSSPARGRYLLIWFTRLPPAGPDRFQAEVYGITVRGSAVHRSSAP